MSITHDIPGGTGAEKENPNAALWGGDTGEQEAKELCISDIAAVLANMKDIEAAVREGRFDWGDYKTTLQAHAMLEEIVNHALDASIVGYFKPVCEQFPAYGMSSDGMWPSTRPESDK